MNKNSNNADANTHPHPHPTKTGDILHSLHAMLPELSEEQIKHIYPPGIN
jgi:hypothetical protein